MKKQAKTYAGVAEKFGKFETAQVLLTSLPYDGTSTWGKGADKGYKAFMDASENMELYDIETNTEPYKNGVYVEKPLKLKDCTPEEMVEKIYKTVAAQLKTGKLLTYFGGEHSVSIGILRAFAKKYKKLTVLQLDAHTDLRPSYMGTPFNHACAVFEARENANLIQVGIRSMDVSEKKYLQKDKVYFAHQIIDNDYWMEEALKKMTNDVYITLDLDVFDSSLMPSTGTPEPGGMHWYQMMQFLRMVFLRKNIVGFDIVELAPSKGNKAPEFLAAKLYYKMLAYYFERKNRKNK
ncbi:MAG: agmatinase [Saprospiraceae bacterium]|nr:agmatinase [Saprospiraceae bacterium]